MAWHPLAVLRGWLIGAVVLASALIFPGPVFADPPAFRSTLGTFNDETTPDTSDGGTITVAAGDTIIFAYWFRQFGVTATVSTVAFNSVAATRLCTATNDGAVTVRTRVEIWGLLAPTAATAAATVTTTANVDNSNLKVYAYTGVSAFAAETTGTIGTSTNWDDSVTTTERNSTVFARGALQNATANPFTVDDTETERGDGDTGTENTNNGAYQDVDVVSTAVGSYNLGGTSDTAVSARWVSCAVELIGLEDNRLRMIGPGMMR